MIKIAIVEDENNCAETLQRFTEKYGVANNVSFSVTRYNNAVDFLTNYKPIYDLVFMDILMPDLNGMDAAKKLRRFDNKTLLIFVTNLAQYAIKGYEVNALDFIVKPVYYQDFAFKMKKAVTFIRLNEDRELVVSQSGGIRRVSIKSIFFLEVVGHKLIYHTSDKKYDIVMSNGAILQISQPKKKKFMAEFAAWLGKGNYLC